MSPYRRRMSRTLGEIFGRMARDVPAEALCEAVHKTSDAVRRVGTHAEEVLTGPGGRGHEPWLVRRKEFQ
jgi:hypothetical protein